MVELLKPCIASTARMTLGSNVWTEGVGNVDLAAIATPALALIERQVEVYPDLLAVADPSGRLTYRQLADAVRRRARGIEAATEPDALVGVLLAPGVEHVVTALACLAARRISVMLDTSWPAVRTSEVAREAGVGLVITHLDPATLPFACRVVAPRMMDESRPHGTPRAYLPVEAPAFITATSGSSGTPKLIVNSQDTIGLQLHGNRTLYGIRPGDRFLFTGAASSSACVLQAVSALVSGAATIQCDIGHVGFRGLLRLIANERINLLRTTPALARALAALPGSRSALSTVRVVRITGEPLVVSDVTALRRVLPAGCRIINAYGSTESTIPFDLVVGEEIEAEGGRVGCGFIRAGGSYAILDDTGEPCPIGVPGELVIKSRYNALGEWRAGRLVPGRLTPDPMDPSQRVYRTGDLARVREDGMLFVLGRIDRQVKINGNRVELAEIEEHIRSVPGVADAFVLPIEGPSGTSITAFVVGDVQGATPMMEAVCQIFRTRLPGYMRPTRTILLAELPRMASGKVDNAALRALAGPSATPPFNGSSPAKTSGEIARELIHFPMQDPLTAS